MLINNITLNELKLYKENDKKNISEIFPNIRFEFDDKINFAGLPG